MKPYWITFEDGTTGCCDGHNACDARAIAEHLADKKVKLRPEPPRDPKFCFSEEDVRAAFFVETLPYPASPTIWRYEHPVHGSCPAFCHHPRQCAGKNSCPRPRACDD